MDYKTNRMDVPKMRVVKYKTKLTADKKVTLEKELSVSRPDLEKTITSPDHVANFAREFLRLHEESEEYLYMICMNTKNVIHAVFELSHGNANSSIFGVREIFQKVLLANAVSIILIHNHPSGNPKPSVQDIESTKRAVEAGRIVGAEVLDHLIIGDNSYVSLKGKGYIG